MSIVRKIVVFTVFLFVYKLFKTWKMPQMMLYVMQPLPRVDAYLD